MTQFRALPVRRGDAFLLQSARGDYLVDGGAPGCDLPALLDERKVKKLRAVISTGTSPERLGGVVDLLSAGRKPSEVWLPDSLRSLADAAFRFDGDYEGWIRLVAKGRGQGAARLFDEPLNDFSETGRAMAAAVNLLCLGFSFCTGEVPPQKKAAGNESGLLFELATQLAQRAAQRSGGCRPFAVGHPVWELLHVANATDLVTLCARMIEQEAMAIPARQRRYRKPLLDSLLLTAQVTLLCAESGARVRYFRYTGRREGGLVPRHPMRCLNGVEIGAHERRTGPVASVEVMRRVRDVASLASSLVFQYGDRECGVLFCSDSRLHFLGQDGVLRLDRPSVITAPRQGNRSAARAYRHIEAGGHDCHVWVRTHYSNARKIASEFRQRPLGLCLFNCADLTMQEVLLSFFDRQWQCLSGGVCHYALPGEGCASSLPILRR